MTSAADRIIDLYQRRAQDWEAERGRDLHEQYWLDRFTALLSPGASILDIGCGSGQPIARHLIEQGYRVTGIDSSPALIDMSRARFPCRDWLVADMRQLSLPQRFQGLLAWNSLFHLRPDDQRRMFPIFRRHAAPNAALMFTSGTRHGEAIGAWHGEPLYHASLDEADYRSLLRVNGFDVVSRDLSGDPLGGFQAIWIALLRDA